MPKKSEAIRRSKLGSFPRVYERLVYQVALWRYRDKKKDSEIARLMADWVKKNANFAYNPAGSIASTTVESYIQKAFDLAAILSGISVLRLACRKTCLL
jgi:hypothetical protein